MILLGRLNASQADKRASETRLKDMWPQFMAQRAVALTAETWTRSERDSANDLPVMSKGMNDAGLRLRRKSVTPYLGLAVTVLSQILYVEGHRDSGSRENSSTWDRVWQPNGMDARQSAVHRGALRDGVSYTTVMPGVQSLTGEKMAKIRGHGAKNFYAGYIDPGNDEWPVYAFRADEQTNDNGSVVWRVEMFDDERVTYLSFDGTDAEYISHESHGIGVCPVIQFPNVLELDGHTDGEVVPFIPIAARIDQTTFDRLIVQRDGAHRVRWATGLMKPPTDAEARAEADLLRMNDILVNSSPDGRFGTFDPTDMKGYIEAREADVKDLSALEQIPAFYYLGQISNMSAEAVAAAEVMLKRKGKERQHNWGERHEQELRLGAHILGDTAAAGDFSSQCKWADLESRSLNQVADALGKLATMLGLPWQMLVDRIPNWTDSDTQVAAGLMEEARQQAQADAEMQAALDAVASQMSQPEPQE